MYAPHMRRNVALLGAAVAAGAVLGVAAAAGGSLSLEEQILALSVVAAPFASMIVRDLKKLLLAAAIVDSLLRWDVNLFFQAELSRQGALAGLDISLTTVALAGLYALWISEALVRRGLAAPVQLRLAAPLVAFVGLSAISIL
ncbi:MAG: hypothetical protein ACR2OD_11575, partial [Gaiellaceae bacterium]